MPVQQLHLFVGLLEVPVQIVELNLAKLHLVAIGGQKALHHLIFAVGGKTEMTDASLGLLLQQIGNGVIGRVVQIGVDVLFIDVVQQVEVKIFGAALFELLLKDLLHMAEVGDVIAGELGGKTVAFPGILGQQLARHAFGIPLVVAPGGVKIVDAVPDGIVDHFGRLCLVNLRVVAAAGQAHHAKAQ